MGTEWASYVDEITSKACNSLGVPPKAVTAELYKLVLYEAGSFFVPHRDTEKANGILEHWSSFCPAFTRYHCWLSF